MSAGPIPPEHLCYGAQQAGGGGGVTKYNGPGPARSGDGADRLTSGGEKAQDTD